jgi:hypothetical protein
MHPSGGHRRDRADGARSGRGVQGRSGTPAGPETRRPAAMCLGRGHVIVYGNPALLGAFGPGVVGVPAREGLVGLPSAAMAVLDVVLEQGRPRARWIRWRGDEWRLTVAPRIDPETGKAYGVSLHLRARSDVPIRVSS